MLGKIMTLYCLHLEIRHGLRRCGWASVWQEVGFLWLALPAWVDLGSLKRLTLGFSVRTLSERIYWRGKPYSTMVAPSSNGLLIHKPVWGNRMRVPEFLSFWTNPCVSDAVTLHGHRIQLLWLPTVETLSVTVQGSFRLAMPKCPASWPNQLVRTLPLQHRNRYGQTIQILVCKPT